MSTPADSAPGRMMSVSLKDKPIAYYSYMPFLEHGGIFVPTNDEFKMGEEVLLVLELFDNPEKFFLRTRGRDLARVQAAHDALADARRQVLAAVPREWALAEVERADLSRFLFAREDLVLVIGQDGLVANAAKYLTGQLVVGVDPGGGRSRAPAQSGPPPSCGTSPAGGSRAPRKSPWCGPRPTTARSSPPSTRSSWATPGTSRRATC